MFRSAHDAKEGLRGKLPLGLATFYTGVPGFESQPPIHASWATTGDNSSAGASSSMWKVYSSALPASARRIPDRCGHSGIEPVGGRSLSSFSLVLPFNLKNPYFKNLNGF